MKLSKLIEALAEHSEVCVTQMPESDPDIHQIRFQSCGRTDPNILYLADRGTAERERGNYGHCNLYLNEQVPPDDPHGISVRMQASLFELRDILQDILDQSVSLSESFRMLYRLAREHPSVQDFLSSIHQILKNDVLVISSAFHVIASVLEVSDFSDYFTASGDGFALSKKSVSYLHRCDALGRLGKSTAPFLVQKDFFPYSALITSIRVEGKVVGYVCALETHHPFSFADHALCDGAAELLSQMFYISNFQRLNEDAGPKTLLDNLLGGHQGNISSYSRIWGWDRYLAMDDYQVIVCTINPEERQQNITHFLHQLKSVFPGVPITRTPQCYVILLYGKRRPLLNEEMEQALDGLLKLHKEKAIISFDFFDIFQTQEIYTLSLIALASAVTDHDEKKTLYSMEELYFQIITSSGIKQTDKRLLIHPDILFLKKYDARNKSELATTLKRYLSCNRSIAEMAESLHISRSTGFYRMNLIRDLLSDPLSDAKKLFCYECSFELIKQM